MYNLAHDEFMRKTFEQTAELLTGKSILFQFSEPLARYANGECFKGADGITRINVSPAQDIQQAYNVALHEMAHAKLSHFVTPMTAAQYQLTAYADARKTNSQPDIKPIESQADALADKWIEKAHQTIKNLIRWYTTPADRAIMNLTALQTLARLKEL